MSDNISFAHELDAIERFIDRIEDRSYSLRELTLLGACVEFLMPFENLEPVPAANVLHAVAIYVGANVWGIITDDGDFPLHRMKVCIRARIKQYPAPVWTDTTMSTSVVRG